MSRIRRASAGGTVVAVLGILATPARAVAGAVPVLVERPVGPGGPFTPGKTSQNS